MSTSEAAVTDATNLAPKSLALKEIIAFLDRLENEIEISRDKKTPEVTAALVKTRARWLKFRNNKERAEGIKEASSDEEKSLQTPVPKPKKVKPKAKIRPDTPPASDDAESESSEEEVTVRRKKKTSTKRSAKSKENTETAEKAKPAAEPRRARVGSDTTEKPVEPQTTVPNTKGGWFVRKGMFTPD